MPERNRDGIVVEVGQAKLFVPTGYRLIGYFPIKLGDYMLDIDNYPFQVTHDSPFLSREGFIYAKETLPVEAINKAANLGPAPTKLSKIDPSYEPRHYGLIDD